METQKYHPEAPRAYEPIALELNASDINSAMQAYLAFLELPDTERAKIAYFNEQRPRIGSSGYVHKEATDIKHVFHMTQELERAFAPNIYRLPTESKVLLKIGQEIYYSLAKSSTEKLAELEEEIPLLVGIHSPRSGKRQHHLRFLAYQAGRDGVLAHGHYDKGTGTIAVAESHGGLRIGYRESDLERIDRSSYEPLFFPGYGWHQLAQMLDVAPRRRAAWHDVTDTGERVDDKTLRWSLIYFIDPANLYFDSTQEQTHTPIPWRGLGRQALRSDGKSFLV